MDEHRGQLQPTTSSRGLAAPRDLDREIAGQIARLLVHYWTENMPATMREAQAQDWLSDLREFSPEVVAEACRQWRQRPGGKRPTPGDIRSICQEEVRTTWQAQAERNFNPNTWGASGLHDLWPGGEAERNAAIAAQEERWKHAAQRRREMCWDCAKPIGECKCQ